MRRGAWLRDLLPADHRGHRPRLRFFIPVAAVGYEYFREGEPGPDLGPNNADRDWAWAAARFGWTPEQFAALTPAQLALLRKEDERRTVELGNLVRDAVQNAVANALRKRGKRQAPLFRKRAQRGKEPTRRVTKAEFGRIERALRGL